MPGVSCKQILPPPPGPVPKRRLEIQQSQSVWELNNQQPDAGIRWDRTAIQTAGAASGGPSSGMWRKKRLARGPAGPTPVAMAAPLPLRGIPASPWPPRPPGVPSGFLVCGQASAERVMSRKDESHASRTRRPAGSDPAQLGRTSPGATSRDARSGLGRHPLGAAWGRGGAG